MSKFLQSLWDLANTDATGSIRFNPEGDGILIHPERFQQNYMATRWLNIRRFGNFRARLYLNGFRAKFEGRPDGWKLYKSGGFNRDSFKPNGRRSDENFYAPTGKVWVTEAIGQVPPLTRQLWYQDAMQIHNDPVSSANRYPLTDWPKNFAQIPVKMAPKPLGIKLGSNLREVEKVKPVEPIQTDQVPTVPPEIFYFDSVDVALNVEVDSADY